jgi:putative endonuclease
VTPRPWSLYIVRCRDGALYTGIALDVRRRLAQHAGVRKGGAKALRGRGPLRVVLTRRLGPRSLALAVECRVKKMKTARKHLLLARRSMLDALIRDAKAT